MNSSYNKFTLNLDLTPERDYFLIINLHGSIIKSKLYVVQSE